MGDVVRFLIRCIATMIVLIAIVQQPLASAADYPAHTITLIVPWPPGGAVDISVRIIARKLSDQLGKPVIVENRPGGGSTVGTAAGAKAVPDGYTLGIPGSGS